MIKENNIIKSVVRTEPCKPNSAQSGKDKTGISISVGCRTKRGGGGSNTPRNQIVEPKTANLGSNKGACSSRPFFTLFIKLK